MATQNKIAVYISVYNEEQYLDETIRSVLNQTYTDFDLIISNNWSTDSSAEIIENHRAKDERIIVWRPDRFCKSLEHGRFIDDKLRMLNYDATIFIGGHDLISRQYVEILYNAYKSNPTAAVIVGSGFEIDRDGKTTMEWPSTPQLKGGYRQFRPLIVLHSLVHCLGIYGLWPKRIKDSVKIRHDCVGSDHLVFAELSLHGDIVVEPAAVIYSRRVKDASNMRAYFDKHISSEIHAKSIVEDFEKQLEWVTHINNLAFEGHPEGIKNISLACSLGCYFMRYGPTSLQIADGALEMWLNSPSGVAIASQLNNIGDHFLKTPHK